MPDKYVENVVERLKRTREASLFFYRKIHRLRRLVAGGATAPGSAGPNDNTTPDVKKEHDSEFYDIFVDTIEEGRSNELLRLIRTLVFQVNHKFPEVEFEDLETEEATLHTEYLRQRLGPMPLGCDAVPEMRKALFDYLIGGLGWVWIGVQNGKPVIRSVDTLDCLWDQGAPSIADARWWSCTKHAPLGWWETMYGAGKFAKFRDWNKTTHRDTPVSLQYYYDLDGPKGNFMVLHKTGDSDVDHEPVIKASNPFVWQYGGESLPYLPCESMMFMELPSVRLPEGLVEQGLPSQIALWRGEKTIRDIVDCPAFYWWNEGTLDATQKQKLEDGKVGSGIEVKEGEIHQHQALEIPQSLLDWRNHHQDALQGHGGADPFATGVPQDVDFASQVNAIRKSAGLMAGTIGRDNDSLWIRTITKFLAAGARADEKELVVPFEGIGVTFDATTPIKMMLRPEARLVVKEGSMQFMDDQTKLQLAGLNLDTAIKANAAIPGRFQAAVEEAYENFVRAGGEKNVKKYTKPPEPIAPGMVPPGMAVPGAVPGQPPQTPVATGV